jgi:hypothetical protein
VWLEGWSIVAGFELDVFIVDSISSLKHYSRPSSKRAAVDYRRGSLVLSHDSRDSVGKTNLLKN